MKPQRAAIGGPLTAALLLAACAFSGAASAESLAKKERRLEHDQAQAAYRLEWDSCRKLKDHAKDTCKVEARGRFQVAKAEIDVKFKRSPANQDRVKFAKADAAYRLALEKCGDLSGNAKDVCKADAKAISVAARGETRLSRASVDQGMYSRQAVRERKDVREDTADAQYAAEKERCDTLAGGAKASCVGEAKKKFGKL